MNTSQRSPDFISTVAKRLLRHQALSLCRFAIWLGFAFAAGSVSADTSGTSGNFLYTDNGTAVTITGVVSKPVGAVDIPAFINGNPVTSIGNSTFSGCSGLTSVTIPASVASIGSRAFMYCNHLTSVTIPSGVTSIGDSAFWNCLSLESVVIPSSVTSIGLRVFATCFALTSISVDPANPNYSSAGGGLFDKSKTTLIQGVSGLGAYSIPSSVTSIGDSAFLGYGSLNSVEIPSSVTSIGASAFNNCSGLTSVSIPSSVTSIGASAFFSCTGLTSLSVDPANPNYSSTGGVLFNKLQTAIIQYPAGIVGAYTIPSGVTSLENSAFAYCKKLTSVTIPASVTSIGSSAFSSCSMLVSISVEALNPSFSSADGVLFNKLQTSLIQCPAGKTGAFTIPAGVIGIWGSAFSNCTALTSVVIPASVTSIASSAFYSCSKLMVAEFLGNAPTMGGSVFSGAAIGFTVEYHTGKTGFSPTWNGYPAVDIGPLPTRIIGLSGNLTFGSLTVNSTMTAVMTVTNTGNSPMTVSGITYPAGFTGNWAAGTIAEGLTQNVTVTFSPSAVQAYGGIVSVSSDSTSGTTTIAASGQGVVLLAPFATWQGTTFTPSDTATGQTTMTSDFEGDGLSNLLEYAFGTDPKTANPSPAALDASGSNLKISFPCDVTRTDITYTVQASSTLAAGSWTDIATSVGGAPTTLVGPLGAVSDSGTGLRTVTVTDSTAIPAVGGRFLRLKVSAP